MRAGLLLVLLLLAACKKEPTTLGDSDKPGPAKCSGDADCQVIALQNCCACCPGTEFYAVGKDSKYSRHCEGHCKVCGGPGSKDGKPVSCETNPKPEDFLAVCRAGTCAYEPKKK